MTIGPITSRSEAFKQVTEALLMYIRSVSVCIVGFTGEKPCEMGSGTCIKIGDRYLIATAAHVIRDYTNDNIRIVHTDKPDSESIPIAKRGAILSADLDIAWLEIDPAHVTSLQKKFISLSQITLKISEVPNDIIFVYGFPSELADKTELSNKLFGVMPIGYSTITRETSRWPSDKKSDFHILIEWPETGNMHTASGSPVGLPEPYGISGGGIWNVNINSVKVWTPEQTKLIGIEYSWRKAERWLCGNQINHWLDLVSKDIPELAEVIMNSTSS